MNLIIDNTPFEVYDWDKDELIVKRDDLASTRPGPGCSKLRGIAIMLEAMKKSNGNTPIGVLDDYNTYIGWGVAAICRELKMDCINFFPAEGSKIVLNQQQIQAKKLGADLIQLKPGRFMDMYARAKKVLDIATNSHGVMIQAQGLYDVAIITGNASEVSNTPKELRKGTWIIPVCSANTACGIMRGLKQHKISYILYSCKPQNADKLPKIIKSKIGYVPDITVIDGNDDGIPIEYDVPFPCNKSYDLKAWRWLMESDLSEWPKPWVFWNIGA